MSSSPRFERPLGLVLAGGGALGSWQVGALAALEKELGPVFDAVIGFSAGAINAAAYALGRTEQALEACSRIDRGILRLAPRLRPLSLFSDRPVRRMLSFLPEEEQARRELRRRLVVVSASYDRERLYHAVFEPGGRWDGPLLEHVMASCAIPVIFPPVRLPVEGRQVLAVDGGVWCSQPMLIDRLGACRDLLVLEMVRPDEPLAPPRGPLQRRYWQARELCRRVIDQAVGALDGQAPRVFRLSPSRRLDFEMLHFDNANLRRGAALGRNDAEAFLAAPERYLATGPSRK